MDTELTQMKKIFYYDLRATFNALFHRGEEIGLDRGCLSAELPAGTANLRIGLGKYSPEGRQYLLV